MTVRQMDVDGGISDAVNIVAKQVKGAMAIGLNEISYAPDAIHALSLAPMHESPSRQWEEVGLHIYSNGAKITFDESDQYAGLYRLKELMNRLGGNLDKFLGIQSPGQSCHVNEAIKSLPIVKSDTNFLKQGYNINMPKLDEKEQIVVDYLLSHYEDLNDLIKPSKARPKSRSQRNVEYAFGMAVHKKHMIIKADRIAKKSETKKRMTVYASLDLPRADPMLHKLVTTGEKVMEHAYLKVDTSPPQSSDHLLLEITVPKGTPIFAGNGTTLLNRNSRFLIQDVKQEDTGKILVKATIV
jgi:hypothetical protein